MTSVMSITTHLLLGVYSVIKEINLIVRSLVYHLVKGEVQAQFYPSFSAVPWYSYYSGQDEVSGTEYTNLFAGWLWFQFRWTHV